MDININITVKSDGEVEQEDGHGILKLKRKTKHGKETIVRLPNMVEDTPPNSQRNGILQNLGL